MQKSTNTDELTFQFKTNINCSGCVARVSKVLDSTDGICHWQVDTLSKDKIMTVHADGITEQEVIAKVQGAGFNIEPIK